MKYITLALSLSAIVVLAGCASGPSAQPVAQVAAPTPITVSVDKYQAREVNEAASAYVSLYKLTIEQSLAENRYKEDLAYKHLSAEACFDSRANRLLAKEITKGEKDELVLSSVPLAKIQAFQKLSNGHFTRVNGLEIFACDLAGLKVSQKDLRY